MKSHIKLWCIIIIAVITIICIGFKYTNASYDTTIKNECAKIKNEKYFKEDTKTRCTLIWQAQIRYESVKCKKVIWNNCFWFRAWKVKKEWKDLWVIWVKKWFLTFKTKEDSIKFYANHFYKFQRYKSISQIIGWWYYCSPKSWWCGNIDGFTHTKDHIPNYLDYVKKYYKNNL